MTTDAYPVTIRPNMTVVRLHILAGAIVDRFWPGCKVKQVHVGVLVKMLTPLMEHVVVTRGEISFTVVRHGLGYKFEQTPTKPVAEMN